MHNKVSFLGLIASVILLLFVFLFALTNRDLFIDDLRGNDTRLNSKNGNPSNLVGEKISGTVVSSQEVQVRESATILDGELDSLQQDQLLQLPEPAIQEDDLDLTLENSISEDPVVDKTIVDNATVDNAIDVEDSIEPITDAMDLNDNLSEELSLEMEPTSEDKELINDAPEELSLGIESMPKGDELISDSSEDSTLEVIPTLTDPELNKDSADIQDIIQELQSMSFIDIRFQFGQMLISSKGLKKIANVADILKANTRISAKIQNYTDSYGDENFNLELSRKRANTVYEAFLESGVDEQQLSFEGLGEANPITSNATLAGRKKNRRTEIQFFEAN